MTTTRSKGGCLCGAVRHRAEGPPLDERVCHRRIRQKTLGAAFTARLLFKESAVVVRGAPAFRASSPGLDRGFWAARGTTPYSRRASLRMVGVTAGSLDDPAAFRPTMHRWTASRQPWISVNDGLPVHARAPPAEGPNPIGVRRGRLGWVGSGPCNDRHATAASRSTSGHSQRAFASTKRLNWLAIENG